MVYIYPTWQKNLNDICHLPAVQNVQQMDGSIHLHRRGLRLKFTHFSRFYCLSKRGNGQRKKRTFFFWLFFFALENWNRLAGGKKKGKSPKENPERSLFSLLFQQLVCVVSSHKQNWRGQNRTQISFPLIYSLFSFLVFLSLGTRFPYVLFFQIWFLFTSFLLLF